MALLFCVGGVEFGDFCRIVGLEITQKRKKLVFENNSHLPVFIVLGHTEAHEPVIYEVLDAGQTLERAISSHGYVLTLNHFEGFKDGCNEVPAETIWKMINLLIANDQNPWIFAKEVKINIELT